MARSSYSDSFKELREVIGNDEVLEAVSKGFKFGRKNRDRTEALEVSSERVHEEEWEIMGLVNSEDDPEEANEQAKNVSNSGGFWKWKK